ncbi:hypothetical protein [Streptomyces sp. WAC06614]|uniref:hypothetical protein n=1 Tax=Streptomyces sp. WAC06614 TaxID=2487416 RepID=UPI000F774801|nr:hypothetical protein [Streptomyces sp. WAC06614]RSS80240.1 hypothetical protein EF918_14460 [Streptomyces sp. WAC06614]
MGIKDQFQDKAQEPSGKAAQARKRGQDEASRRSQQPKEKKEQGQESLDDLRGEMDDPWD